MLNKKCYSISIVINLCSIIQYVWWTCFLFSDPLIALKSQWSRRTILPTNWSLLTRSWRNISTTNRRRFSILRCSLRLQQLCLLKDLCVSGSIFKIKNKIFTSLICSGHARLWAMEIDQKLILCLFICFEENVYKSLIHCENQLHDRTSTKHVGT